MKRVIRTAAMALVTASILATSVVPSTAGDRRHDRDGDIVAGALLGVAGAVIVGSLLQDDREVIPDYAPTYGYEQPRAVTVYRERPVYREIPVYKEVYREVPVYRDVPVYRERPARRSVSYRLSADHIAYCQNRYRSYRISDDTFQPYHGPRRRCI